MLLYHKVMDLFLKVLFCLQMLSITDLDFSHLNLRLKTCASFLKFIVTENS